MQLTKNSLRDGNIDLLKAFAMMWVIVVHCLGWPGLFTTGSSMIIKSYLLIEMPLFFFLTGASHCLSRPKSLPAFYVGRLQRILIPYWIYSALCVVLTIIDIRFKHPEGAQSLNILNWILPFNRQFTTIPYLNLAFWFVPIYLIVSITLPFLKSYFDKANSLSLKLLPIPILSALLIILDLLKLKGLFMWYFMPYILYSLWAYIGFFYQNIKKQTVKKSLFAFGIFAICAITIYLLTSFGGYTPDMQVNKFPPNTAFLMFSFAALAVVYLIHNGILWVMKFIMKCPPIRFLIEPFYKHSYTVYLFHPLSILSVMYIINLTKAYYLITGPEILTFFTYLCISLFVSSFLGRIFGWCEKIIFFKPKPKAEK